MKCREYRAKTVSNAKQIVAMLRSRAEGDEEQFFSIALQVAASEARQGRRDTANDIRAAVDASRAAHGVRPSILRQRNQITTHELTLKLSERQAMRAAFTTAR